MLKVALFGLGMIGSMHAATWKRIEGVALSAVCTASQATSRAAAERYGTAAFADMEQLLAWGDFDIVDICLPTPLHKSVAIRAAECGKHVICEKPLALNAADAEDIAAACRKHGVRLFVGHVLRFCPEYAQARELVRTGTLGDIGIVHLSRSGAYPSGSGHWYGDANKSGGLALDMLIHDLDWLLWTFGDIERLAAQRVARDTEDGRLEAVSATVRMTGGTLALVKGSWAFPPFATSFEIAGRRGLLSHHSGDSTPLSIRRRDERGALQQQASLPAIYLSEDPMYVQLNQFIQCLRRDLAAPITPEDAVRAVKACGMLIEAIGSGQPVTAGKEARP